MSIYILQIDTATDLCSVSISLNGKTVGVVNADQPNMHASRLTLQIEELLKNHSLAYSDLAAVAVSMGPGSYTGLRIGVSTAKGLCYALDIPLIAVNTLFAMFNGVSTSHLLKNNALYIPMLDARRMEVYMAIFNDDKSLIADTSATIIESNTFDAFENKSVILFGSGAKKLKELFVTNSSIIIDDSFEHSSAFLSELSYAKFQNNDFEDLIYFEPLYLKEFIATTPKKVI